MSVSERVRPRFQPSLHLSLPPNSELNSCRALGKAVNPLGLSCTIYKKGVILAFLNNEGDWAHHSSRILLVLKYDCLCLYSDWVLTAQLLWFSNFLVSEPFYSFKIFEDLKIPFVLEAYTHTHMHTHTYIYISLYCTEIEIRKFLWSISLLY